MTVKIAKLPLWLIALGTGSAVMGITLITPALPIVAEELEVSAEKVQQLLTIYLFFLAIGQLIVGPLSDVFGRRFFFAIGSLLIGLAGTFAILAKNIDLLIFYRAIQGLGAAACLSMGRTIINDFFDKVNASKAMATVQTIQAIVPMMSLSCGGALVFYTGWQGVMFLISIAGVIIFFGSFFLLPETNLDKIPHLKFTIVKESYIDVIKNRLFLLYLSVSSFQIGAFFALNSFIPYAYKELGSSALAFGIWFSLTPLAYLLGNIFNRFYMIKRGLEKAILIGCALSVFSVLLMAFLDLTNWQSPLRLAIPCIIFGFANGLTVANATIGGLNSVSKGVGTASGLIGSVTMIVGALSGALLIFFGADKSSLTGILGLLIMIIFSLWSSFQIYLANLKK